MADEKQPVKGITPKTKEIVTTKKSTKNKANISPQNLFIEDGDTNSGGGPSQSAPTARRSKPRKEDRTLVLTSQGKKVLSSDACLHLEKIKLQKKVAMTEIISKMNEVENELKMLDKERRILAEKIKQKREILRLQKELEDVSGGRLSSEYQTEEYESSWRPSKGSEYMYTEDSSSSFSSRRKKNEDQEIMILQTKKTSIEKGKRGLRASSSCKMTSLSIKTSYGHTQEESRSLLRAHCQRTLKKQR